MTQSSEMPGKDDDWKKSPGKKKKTFRLEYRVRPEKAIRWLNHHHRWREWTLYYTKYATKAQRDEAMRVMNRKDTLFEYRIPE